jgi:hypothetical protein
MATRLQLSDGALRPPILDQQAQGMAGEKRVVRVGAGDIRVPLQAKLQYTALLAGAVGEGRAKRCAK